MIGFMYKNNKERMINSAIFPEYDYDLNDVSIMKHDKLDRLSSKAMRRYIRNKQRKIKRLIRLQKKRSSK